MPCCLRSTGNCRLKVYTSRPAKSASLMPPSLRPNRAALARMPTARTTQDSEAGYNVKVAANGKKTSTYGYKAHVNVDEDGFIKAVDYTPGNEHDSKSLEKLLTYTEEQVYADKAYASTTHDKLLAKRNTGNRILHKARRNQPLSDRQKHQNRQWASVRSTVERVFGILKQHYGIAKARYLGLKRNQARFMLAAMAYNIKRGVAVQAEMLAFAG